MLHQGWLDLPHEVDKHLKNFKYQSVKDVNLPSVKGESVLPYLLVRKIINKDVPIGPQLIGDCVSWGWGNAVNYTQLMMIAKQLKILNTFNLINQPDFKDHPNYLESKELINQYEETCTEAIYALSRVEIGKQRGSMEDGSTGIWASNAVTTYGTLSRKKLGVYDPKRAKKWGAEGLPDDLEPEAKQHTFNNSVLVTSYNDALPFLRNYRFIPVCSNQGFTEKRDNKGRCFPQGQWMHCMLFCALDEDSGNVLCSQSWGEQSPTGPLYLDQPINTFWVEPDVVDSMLKQRDSYAPADFNGYVAEDFIDWKF